ncbi:MAG: helix-turn-helix transcriptional regulator [Oscillospiraceae bacterium]|nr:helix-turn-helix transcriptional regulator [Oscillospiraceae bacterium]MBQ7001269.1 helix-turn-helix transcriptional regulator [Oscillospiraceae bacterium]
MTDKKLGFLEYVELAKQELKSVRQIYPELTKLSPREMEVFAHLLSDKTQEEIARELFISSSSVHFHCKNIYKKLEVSGRRQILIKYKNL